MESGQTDQEMLNTEEGANHYSAFSIYGAENHKAVAKQQLDGLHSNFHSRLLKVLHPKLMYNPSLDEHFMHAVSETSQPDL